MLFQVGYGRFGPFSQALAFLESMGLLDALVPFVLLFTIFFFTLRQINLFNLGAGGKKAYLVIALSLTLMTVVPHVLGYYPANADVIVIINNSAPQLIFIIFMIMLALILTGAISGAGTKSLLEDDKAAYVALGLVALVVLGALWPAGWLGFIPSVFYFLLDPFFYVTIIMIGLFSLIVYLVVSD